MFTIIPPEAFVTTAWKNGGGVTHEILRDTAADPWRWRISIAEVASDGPFSSFDGLERILTVIEGDGLDLHTPQGVLQAQPLRPLPFSGALPVDSRMVKGPVRDLNLIYDPQHVSASVEVIDGPATFPCGAEQTGVLCLAGAVTLAGDPLPPGAFGMGQGGSIALGPDARCIVIRMTL